MDSNQFKNLNRRDFLKYSLLAAGAATLPGMAGCATPGKNVPKLDYSKTFFLTNCNVIDVVTGNITKNASVTINNGKISSINTEETDKAPDAVVINMDNKYLTPGLIDAHCHSTVSPVFGMSLLDLLKHSKQQKQNYISSVESGVTTLRDMGSFPGMLDYFMNGIEDDSFPGPRVIYCNSMLNLKGSHPEVPPSDVNVFAVPASWFIGMVMNNFDDSNEMQKCLRKNAEGASFIKLTMDNKSVFCKQNDNIPVYTDDQLRLIFKFADDKQLPVAVHHHFKFGFDRALNYPIHSLEHIVSDTVLSDEDILKMKDKNVSIVPTATVGQSFLMEEAFDVVPKEYRTDFIDNELKVRNNYFKDEAHKHCNPYLHQTNMNMLKYYKTIGWNKLWSKKKFLVNPHLYYGMVKYGSENLKKMRDAGIQIGCGIDAGMPFCYFGGMYREFEIYARLGFSNLEILQSATINNARILQIEDLTGTLAAGKSADIVAYETNPLEDITALRTPSLVFREGKMMFSGNNLVAEGKMIA